MTIIYRIIVALAALLLSVWEGIKLRCRNRLSVLPHLERTNRLGQFFRQIISAPQPFATTVR